MKNYLDIPEKEVFRELINSAIALKKSPYAFSELGKNKTLGLLFFNSSLRTRLSTQKASLNLGMTPLVVNLNNEVWPLEFEEGCIMDGNSTEHVKEAAAVISQYCDIIAIRAFPTLTNKEQDLSEHILESFTRYASVPIINMESSTKHPLQGLADAMTIVEYTTKSKPKVVLSWAPHPKALPQAVPNSFVRAMHMIDVDLVITHPRGYELDPQITKGSTITYNQDDAFENADFIYTKNWSSFQDYGKILSKDPNWRVTPQKMSLTHNAKFMHCLPVRRNVIVDDAVIDSPQSIVIEQANNRTYATQSVLKSILEYGS